VEYMTLNLEWQMIILINGIAFGIKKKALIIQYLPAEITGS
jgi:hypothetical protein